MTATVVATTTAFVSHDGRETRLAAGVAYPAELAAAFPAFFPPPPVEQPLDPADPTPSEPLVEPAPVKDEPAPADDEATAAAAPAKRRARS